MFWGLGSFRSHLDPGVYVLALRISPKSGILLRCNPHAVKFTTLKCTPLPDSRRLVTPQPRQQPLAAIVAPATSDRHLSASPLVSSQNGTVRCLATCPGLSLVLTVGPRCAADQGCLPFLAEVFFSPSENTPCLAVPHLRFAGKNKF